MMGKTTFNIVANGVWGPEGLSGGDNIFINFGRFLRKLGHAVDIYTWEDGVELCRNHGLKEVNFHLWPARKYGFLGFPGLYLLRAVKGCFEVLKMKKTNGKTIVYSSSDFWPDSIPAFLMSRRLNAPWIAGFYLFSPDPRKNIRNFLFWLTQKPIFWLITKYAKVICVTSEPDVEPFIKAGRLGTDILVIKGGIDYKNLEKFQQCKNKIYDAIFVGRFHPQKGVLEMIDIWKNVVTKIPSAKLAIIGVGPLEEKMKEKVRANKLEENVLFLGVLIGEEKNEELQKARIFLHPVVYDSGGMAPAEGLACGLPGVCFDLPVLRSYYNQGFIRAKIGDLSDYADRVTDLLENQKLYKKLSLEAIEEAKSWDWKERVNYFLDNI